MRHFFRIKELYRIIEGRPAGEKSKKLRVFDFDDTLVRTDARVGVAPSSGKKFWLTPGEYATYEKHPEDQFDYSEFGQIKNPKIIPWTTNILRKVYEKNGPLGAVILTARGTQSQNAIKQFLDDAGMPGIEIVTLGDSNPQAKSNWIKQKMMSDGIDHVEFFDDSKKNVEAVADLKSDLPDRKIKSRKV